MGEFYLVDSGEKPPTAWPFVLYKTGLADGFTFTVDVIDTWNMTITPLEGVYEIKKKDDYMALRIRRVGPIVPVTPPKRDHET